MVGRGMERKLCPESVALRQLGVGLGWVREGCRPVIALHCCSKMLWADLMTQ